MAAINPYQEQVRQLVRLLPFIGEESCFALKGGTAINLFIRDCPRLSVDIDLVYLPLNSREAALDEIHDALDRLAIKFTARIPDLGVVKSYRDKLDALRLVVEHPGGRIKIGLSPVMRGTVFPTQVRRVVSRVENEYGFAETSVVSFEDLYAGKICAALDRQHPRDLFDIHQSQQTDGGAAGARTSRFIQLVYQ